MLATVLQRKIATKGPISVADYMELCLSHYYGTRDPLGAQGDFTTAPEISQIFGELCGAWLADGWLRLGSPAAVTLMELGPGRGTLMKDILRATKAVPGFHGALTVVMVETSPALRAKQQEMLVGMHPRIEWSESIALPDKPLLFIANEFFDALPIHQFIDGQERHVDWDGTHFHFVIPAKTGILSDEEEDSRFRENDKITETCPAATRIVTQLSQHLTQHTGAGLIIDYGYTGGSRGDTFQAVKSHAFADPLIDPGEADLTAHVDFDALGKAAKPVDTQVMEQGAFLKMLGAEQRAARLCAQASETQQQTILAGLNRLIDPEQMGTLFKVMALQHGFRA